MKSLKAQLRQALRRLGRAPMFTAATLATLAVGIGANTAMFSVIEGVLLRPLRYPHSEQLIGVWHTAPGIDIKLLPTSPSMYFIYREQNRVFQDVGLYDGGSANITGIAEPERVNTLRVTDGTLPILGIPPMLGRSFNRADDSPGGAETVLLTYGYWRRKFGSDTSAVGRSIRVDGKARQIIGVMPEQFHVLDSEDPALILPFQLDRSKMTLGDFSYPAVARLRPGSTLTEATADVARMTAIVNRSFPAPPGFSPKIFEEARIGPNLQPLKQVVVGDVGRLLWIIMGGIGIVLLIACANVANLLLVRAEGRQLELAVRAALGASRGRIASELLLESLVLGIVGGAAGLALAYGALRVLGSMVPAGLPRLHEIGIDSTALLFNLVVSLFASLLFGAIPIFKYAGACPGSRLHEGGRTSSQSRERHRARSTLVVVQVALALVLMISSGLMLRTFRALTKVQPGFSEPASVQTVRLTIPNGEVPEPERVVRMQEEITRKLAAIPGVSSVALGTNVPMDGSINRNPIFAQDRTYAEGSLPPLRNFKFVSPGYFGTLGTPFLAGRDFTWTEVYAKRPVAIVSENLAREYWHVPASALGKRIRMGQTDDWCEIVGVVANIYYEGVYHDPPATVNWPIYMRRFWDEEPMVRRTLTIVMRSNRAGTESFLKEIRHAVWSVNRSLPLADMRSLEDYYWKSMSRTSFTLVMLAVAGAMALLLGVVGLYGVIAYSVSQRTREIGIRVALGAQRREITGMFLRHGLLLTVTGVACGLGTALAVIRVMSSLLFKVNPVDFATYAAMCGSLILTTLVASYLPSRRAAAVDPAEALRSE
jgi:predicted permease